MEHDLLHQESQIDIAAGCLSRIRHNLECVFNGPRIAIVTDDVVDRIYANTVCNSIVEEGRFATERLVVPCGEQSKSLHQLGRLYDRLAELHWGRDEPILALGGGVVTDLAGFLAATWNRGVPLVNCPTTLEGAVDAAIGGKCGVNHASGKNLIGAFYPAWLVIIDPECLMTLPERVFRSGLAESVKHAAIADEAFLAWHEANLEGILGRDAKVLEELIERNVRIKMDIVKKDEHEQLGQRQILNFGHTLGHALEAYLDFELTHGECVALGMRAASAISEKLDLLQKPDAVRLGILLDAFGFPRSAPRLLDPEAILNYIRLDKKIRSGKTQFILLEAFARPVLRDDVPPPLLREAIESINRS